MSTEPKTIAIVGVTGNQGSSVAKTFLQLPGWHVRGLTRNLEKASTNPALQGVEFVAADLNEPGSLVKAFSGAHVIFGTTDFFALLKSPEVAQLAPYKDLPATKACFKYEVLHGKNIVDAAAHALAAEGVLETFVLSTSSDAKRWSKGVIVNLLHFDSKAETGEYLKTKYPELAAKTQSLQVGFYMQNVMMPLLLPQRQPDNSYVFSWPCVAPDTILAATDPTKDTGKFVAALIEAPHGTAMLGESDEVSVQQYIELWSKVTGKDAHLEAMSAKETEEKMNPVMPGGFGREFAENFQYYRDYGFTGGDPAVQKPWQLSVDVSKLAKFEDFLREQDWSTIL